jgi:hypothetical protein
MIHERAHFGAHTAGPDTTDALLSLDPLPDSLILEKTLLDGSRNQRQFQSQENADRLEAKALREQFGKSPGE